MQNKLTKLSGVGDKTMQKLDENGFSTVLSIGVASPAEIAMATGLSENNARKIIRSARENVKLGFEKAKDFVKNRDKTRIISTGCKEFDEMLGGGFPSGGITEIFARWGSGKTQISHLITVRALLDNEKSKAIYIDTENTFRDDRIKDFAKANKLDEDKVLERIMIGRALNTDHQLLLLDEVENMIQKDDNYNVLVVDSLTSHFRSEMSGRGELAGRQQKLNKHMHQLLKIADIYNLVVVVTNQVQADPGIFYGNPEKPIGGNIVGHGSTSRLYMRPGKKGSIFAKLVDSPNLPQNECNFNITKDGLKGA